MNKDIVELVLIIVSILAGKAMMLGYADVAFLFGSLFGTYLAWYLEKEDTKCQIEQSS